MACVPHGCPRSPGFDAERPRSRRRAHASAWAGWRRAWQTYSSMWLICLDGGSLRAHVRSLCQLVIALDRIRSALILGLRGGRVHTAFTAWVML